MDRQAGEFLGVSGNRFNQFMHYRNIPKEFDPSIELRFKELTGKTTDELFPGFTRVPDFLAELEPLPEVSIDDLTSHGLLDLSEGSPEDELIKSELRDRIEKALDSLTPRERKILMLRFGWGEKPQLTLEEIGKLFDVAIERARQIEIKALRKLRSPSRARLLNPFVH